MEIVSIDSRLHCRFAVFSTVHTYTFEAIEDHRMKRSDVSLTLYACYEHTRLRYFTAHMVQYDVIIFFFMSFRLSTLI